MELDLNPFFVKVLHLRCFLSYFGIRYMLSQTVYRVVFALMYDPLDKKDSGYGIDSKRYYRLAH